MRLSVASMYLIVISMQLDWRLFQRRIPGNFGTLKFNLATFYSTSRVMG